jgi:hypothetical protein
VGRDHIPTQLSDLSRYGARAASAAGEHSHDHGHDHDEVHVLEARHRVLGLFWTDYRIEIDYFVVDEPDLAAEVLWSEAAHAIDQAMLTDAQRAEIVAALHPEGPDEHTWWERPGEDYGAAYNRLIGESAMQIVVEVYTPLKATINLHHEVTPHVLDVARRILTPELVESAGPAPFFGLRESRSVHDNHRGIDRQVEWTSLREALDAGRRPCRVCRPREA